MGARIHWRTAKNVTVAAVKIQHYDLAAIPMSVTRVLEQSMTRLLQLYRVWDKDRDGNISVSEFGAALTSMNVPHTTEDVKGLFAVLGSPDGRSVTLDDLLQLKAQIDDQMQIDRSFAAEDGEPGQHPSNHTGNPCWRSVVLPILGTVWKSELRPHHALESVPQGVAGLKRTHAIISVQSELRTWKPHPVTGKVHVQLTLTTIRGPTRPRRQRPEYRAGRVPSLVEHVEETRRSVRKVRRAIADRLSNKRR
jgi:hypothetical protein